MWRYAWLLVWTATADLEKPKPLFDFNPTVASAYAALAQAAYCDATDELQQWDCPECKAAGFALVPNTTRFVHKAEIGEKNSTFALLARVQTLSDPEFQDGCAIAFRGSDTFTNWLLDFAVWGKHVPFSWCEGCYVAHGWYSILQNIYQDLLQTLNSLGCNKNTAMNKLYITGHSLGAALATLAMCAFQEEGYDVRTSYIWESPRVGNKVFASVFDKVFSRNIPVWRVTHDRDPFVHLPPRGFFIQYTHVNTEVFFNKNWNMTICTGTEDPRCSGQHSWLPSLPYGYEHCQQKLAVNSDICNCPFKQKQRQQQLVV